MDKYIRQFNPNKGETVDSITLEKGQIVKIAGMPFQLAEDTVVLGKQQNYELAKKMEADGAAGRSQQLAHKDL